MENRHKFIKVYNYKSIRELDLRLNKVNLFIGNPTSGKSNIIECFRLLSQNGIRSEFFSDYRLDNVTNLFRNNNIIEEVSIETDLIRAKFNGVEDENGRNSNHVRALFDNHIESSTTEYQLDFQNRLRDIKLGSLETNLRFYEFNPNVNYSSSLSKHLKTPHGANFIDVAQRNERFKSFFADLIKDENYRYVIEYGKGQDEKFIKILREKDDELILFPFKAFSDTVRRYAFLMAALESNKNSSVIFDEPESNVFPFYIKLFGERIGIDEDNQFSIATHSTYLVNNIISKTDLNDLAVNFVYLENFETKVLPLNHDQIQLLIELDIDIPFNLDLFR